MGSIDPKGTNRLFNKSVYKFQNIKREKDSFKRAVDDDSEEDNDRDDIDYRSIKRFKLGTPSKSTVLLNKTFVLNEERKKSLLFTFPVVNHKSYTDNEFSPASNLSSSSTEEDTESDDGIEELLLNLKSKLPLSPMDYSPKLTPPKPLADKAIIKSDEDKTPVKMNISGSTISPKTPQLNSWRSTKSNTPYFPKYHQIKENSNCEDETIKSLYKSDGILSEELLKKFECLTIGTPKHFNKTFKAKCQANISPVTTPIKTKTDDPNSIISKIRLNAPKKSTKFKRDILKESSNISPIINSGESPTLRLVKRENMQTLQSSISRKCMNRGTGESPVQALKEIPSVSTNITNYMYDSPQMRKQCQRSNRGLIVRFVENLDRTASEIADELELVMRYRPGRTFDDLNNNTPRQSTAEETPKSSKKKPRSLFTERSPNLIYV